MAAMDIATAPSTSSQKCSSPLLIDESKFYSIRPDTSTLSYAEFGDSTQEDLNGLKKEWFPDDAENEMVLQSIWFNHSKRKVHLPHGAGGGTPLQLQVQELKYISESISLLLSLMLSDKILRETDIFYVKDVTAPSGQSQVSFKLSLVQRYLPQTEKTPKQLTCLITGAKLAPQDCIAGHIVPHSAAYRLVDFGLSCLRINDSNNGLLWAQGIEDVFHPAGQVCILHDFLHNKMVFRVLDKSLLNQVIHPTSKKFKDVDGKFLLLPEDVFPNKEFIACHARAAILAAHKNKWISTSMDSSWADCLRSIDEFMKYANTNQSSDPKEAIKRMSEYNVRALNKVEDGVERKKTNTLVCNVCKHEKITKDFSRNQRTKGSNRKCLSCIDKAR